jgi:hypothetical protein
METLSGETIFTLSHHVIPRLISPRNPYDGSYMKLHPRDPHCARNDMIAGKMNSYLIQTQSNIVFYVNFPHNLEETPLIFLGQQLFPSTKQCSSISLLWLGDCFAFGSQSMLQALHCPAWVPLLRLPLKFSETKKFRED